MGEHRLTNGFRDYPQTGERGGDPTSPACKDREHQYGVIVQAMIPTPMPNGTQSAIQLSRVVCLKCGSVIDPFPEFSTPLENPAKQEADKAVVAQLGDLDAS